MTELLTKGLIWHSKSAYSSLMILVRKKDQSWCMCINYRALNKVTIPDKFPIPMIDELLDELHGSYYFSKLYLNSEYHQILMKPENVEKTAFKTHEEAQRFIVTVGTKSLSQLTDDRIWWNGAKDGIFSVKSSYDVLNIGGQHLVPVKMIWNPIVPTKVGFFVWEVWWGKILTMDQLKKRGHSLASRCPFCGQKEEDMEHLLIHCSKVWELWTTLFSLSEGGWVCPYTVKELLMGWVWIPLKKKEVKLWRAAPLCLLWAIWIERNKVVFEDMQFSLNRLKTFFLRSFREWTIMIPDVNLSFLRGVLGRVFGLSCPVYF